MSTEISYKPPIDLDYVKVAYQIVLHRVPEGVVVSSSSLD